jgi:amino acid/amide ABC transporter membrane protein 1, HAAT family (TC 3.A.1.4.-)
MDVIPYFLSGLILGSIYGLTTLGLSLIFGVLREVNVAHGSFVMLGAYMAYFAFILWAWPPFATALLAFAIGALLGYLVYIGVRGSSRVDLQACKLGTGPSFYTS